MTGKPNTTKKPQTQQPQQTPAAANPGALRFNDDGLIPVIAQCADSGAVLMMAWMTRETLAETMASGQMVYYSRSRKCRWRKGEQSGNTQQCQTLTADCDGDTILAKVRQKGAACHTGAPTCFFTPLPTKTNQ